MKDKEDKNNGLDANSGDKPSKPGDGCPCPGGNVDNSDRRLAEIPHEKSGEVFDGTISQHHVISRATGEALEILDPVKRDNFNINLMWSLTWLAHGIVAYVCTASFYAQLLCTPPRPFVPPVELIGIALGIYFGNGTNLVKKALEWKLSRK